VESADGVLFIGYHARAGTPMAILDHTWSSRCIRNVWLNDVLMGEYGLNAAVAGHFGVPVLMVSGDQTICAQVVELLGEGVETAVVKQALGRFAAECLAPQVAQSAIREAASRAVTRLDKGKTLAPFLPHNPVRLRVEFSSSDMVDRVMRLPEAKREGVCASISAGSMPAAYALFRGMVALAAG
jgi:D-amino peptidase